MRIGSLDTGTRESVLHYTCRPPSGVVRDESDFPSSTSVTQSRRRFRGRPGEREKTQDLESDTYTHRLRL